MKNTLDLLLVRIKMEKNEHKNEVTKQNRFQRYTRSNLKEQSNGQDDALVELVVRRRSANETVEIYADNITELVRLAPAFQ